MNKKNLAAGFVVIPAINTFGVRQWKGTRIIEAELIYVIMRLVSEF